MRGGCPRNITSEYDYDILDRKVEVRLPSPLDNGVPEWRTATYNYDQVGMDLRETYTDPKDNQTITISEYNGPVLEKQTLEGINGNYRTTFIYDEIDQLIEIQHPNAMQASTYNYDVAGNMIQAITPDKPLINYMYDARAVSYTHLTLPTTPYV